MSFQSASDTSKETTAHFSIFYGPGVHVSPSAFLSDKTVLHDNTKLSTASEIPTQPQQGSCTVYTAVYILFQSHLYLITRTKIYFCSQYLYFPFGSSDNFSHRVELKLTWQAGFISISSAKPFQLGKPTILSTVLRSELLLVLCEKITKNTKSKQTRKWKQGWGEPKQFNI